MTTSPNTQPAAQDSPQNGQKRRRRLNINIGTVVFLIILIYMVISVILYIGRDPYSVVEVQRGSIVDNGYFTGIILRSEELVNTTTSGTINFYVGNGEKVAKDGSVYVLGTSQDGGSGGDFSDFNSQNYTDLSRIISLYTSNYDDSSYSDLYTFKYDLQNQISEAISSHNISSLQTSSGTYQSVASDKSGIVSYTYDGMEGLTKDDITDDMFNSNNYEKYQIVPDQWLDAGSVAYKLITDDNWSIVIKLTPEQAKSLSDREAVTVRFSKDNIETSANVEIFSNGESNYALLSLSKYMVRYIADRYIDIELIESSAEGLKIPTSAVTEKEFYKIPVDYLVTDEDTSEEGFYRYTYDSSGELNATLDKIEIYAKDEAFCYVDTSDFEMGDTIGKPDSSDTYRIGATGNLTGVYNINQGYAIFRIVDILYQNDEYCIVEDDTAYGVALYDRIILNAAQVNEDQIIY